MHFSRKFLNAIFGVIILLRLQIGNISGILCFRPIKGEQGENVISISVTKTIFCFEWPLPMIGLVQSRIHTGNDRMRRCKL